MTAIYENIYREITKLASIKEMKKVGFYRKFESEGFMDLNLETIRKGKNYIVIALSHYYKQNGDLMSDPDMEIKVYTLKDWKMAEALTYQQDSLGKYEQVYVERNGKEMVNLALKLRLNKFLYQWLKRIQVQGYEEVEK